MATKRPINNLYVDGTFRYGCIEMQDMPVVSLNTANFLSGSYKLNILFLAILDDPWKGESHIGIHMFQLPGGQEEFDRVQKWFGKERKQRARLPDGIPFEESALAIRDLPYGWKHTAFPRSCRDFIHIYSSVDQAILLRVKGQRGTVLDNPLLRLVPENIRVVPEQWETTRPRVIFRNSEAQVQSIAIDESQYSEVRSMSENARKLLGCMAEVQGLECANAIYRYLESVRAGRFRDKNGTSQTAIELGCLWGEVLQQTGRWEWRVAIFAPGQECLALFNETGTHAVAPMVVLQRILTSKRVDNNLMLLHNMLLDDKLPPTIENGIVWLN